MSGKTQSVIVGLGNPGKETNLPRHNAGRIFLYWFAEEKQKEKAKISEWEFDKKINSLKSRLVKNGGKMSLLLVPETYMNKSGEALKKIITSKIKARSLALVHDDLDLPLGKFKISYNRGSAGHKGVESIIKAVKTNEFARVRIGISPVSPKGKIKKPKTEKLSDFITGKFKKEELIVLKRIYKHVSAALDLITEGKLEQAMNKF